MNIAVTGTVGSGKSCVTAMFTGLLGVSSVDTDALCRRLLLPGQAGWLALRERWSTEYFDGDGHLDRIKLREAVFSDPEVRRGLEGILHTRVRAIVDDMRREAAVIGRHLVVEVPLLYETGWDSDFDYTVVVYVSQSTSIDRTVRRDNVSVAQAESILAIQLPPLEKAARADIVIDNSGTWAATVLQVNLLIRKLKAAYFADEKAA